MYNLRTRRDLLSVCKKRLIEGCPKKFYTTFVSFVNFDGLDFAIQTFVEMNTIHSREPKFFSKKT